MAMYYYLHTCQKYYKPILNHQRWWGWGWWKQKMTNLMCFVVSKVERDNCGEEGADKDEFIEGV